MPHATVIGAGIGGLSAALALHGKGWDVTVYERAHRLEAVGSGIAVAPNGLRGLDTLGLGDTVRGLSAVSGSLGGIRDHRGRRLLRLSEPAAAARFGDTVVLLPRDRLIAALSAGLPESRLRLGVTAEVRDAAAGTVSAGGAEHVSDLVVAADGIGSGTRARLFPTLPGPRDTGITAWRVIIDADRIPVHPTEYWGRGGVFGTMPMDGGTVYAYASAVAEARATMHQRFGDWAHPIPALLRRADPEAILRHPVRILPRLPAAFHRGRVALLGDAAHPMEPHLGQGACQAIEDAVELAHLAGESLDAYTRARHGRAAMVVSRSHTMARMTRLRHPLAVAARDLALRTAARVAPRAIIDSGQTIFGWTPPAR